MNGQVALGVAEAAEMLVRGRDRVLGHETEGTYLPEEIALGRDGDVRRPALAADVEPADDGDRDAPELAGDELGSRRDLVGDRDHGRVQLVAVRVALALEVR